MIARRELITLLSGAAMWPMAARAQQGERMRRVGVLMSGVPTSDLSQSLYRTFHDVLHNLGWTQGRNIDFLVRWEGADAERRARYAREIVAQAPDVILAFSGPVSIAVRKETASIPIVVAAGADPVRSGLVANLARQEGNVTGFPATEPSVSGKWLELLVSLAPDLRRVAIVESPENPVLFDYRTAAQSAAQGRIVEIVRIEARDDAQLERDIGAFADKPNGSVLVLPGPSTGLHIEAIISAADRRALPAVYPFRQYAMAGGLMSYGPDLIDITRRAAGYVHRVLSGESIHDLPVQFPTKFELVINLRTAKSAGLAVPATLLAIADEVIE